MFKGQGAWQEKNTTPNPTERDSEVLSPAETQQGPFCCKLGISGHTRLEMNP